MGETGLNFGAYRLLERLGKGGMGETWHAVRDDGRGVSKDVVIKRILRSVSDDPQFVEAFISEARLSARLSHGNVAQVFEFGEVQGEYFMALEFVHGQSLGAALERARERGLRGVPPAFAVYVAMEMLKGLQHAHKRTGPDGQPLLIVHRDVSPDNVLLSYEGEVKMVDFGIAKAQLAGRAETEPGMVKGKYLYFSPEQAHADPLDARTDVFATGVVLYSMLAGRLPLEGQPHVVLHKLVRGEFPSLTAFAPWVPENLERVVRKAMSPRREDRYPSALEFQQALAAVLRELAPDASQVTVSGMMTWLFGQELSSLGRTVVVPGPIQRLVSLHQSEVKGDNVVTGPSVRAQPKPIETNEAPATDETHGVVRTAPGVRKLPPIARNALIGGAALALTLGIIFAVSPEEHRNLSEIDEARVALARGDLDGARTIVDRCKQDHFPCVGGDALIAGAERSRAENAAKGPAQPPPPIPVQPAPSVQPAPTVQPAPPTQVAQPIQPAPPAPVPTAAEERRNQLALIEAATLIMKGQHLDKAKQFLDSAAGTVKYRQRYLEIKDSPDMKLYESQATSKKPEDVGVDPPHQPGDVVKNLTEQGRDDLRKKDYAAARKTLTDCVKIDPRAYECAKLLGSTFAKLEQPAESVKWYRKFLETAPADHPDRSKVDDMIKNSGR